MNKSRKILALTLVTSLIVFAALGAIVFAQSTATVTILASVGGTTDPEPGTTTYDDGTSVTFTATPDTAYVFQNWIVSTDEGSSIATDSSITIPVVGGTTYTIQATFQPILPTPPNTVLPTNLAAAAIVVVLAGSGGTTSPAPGTYALTNASSFNLTATPLSGWQFSHWIISGSTTNHGGAPVNLVPTDNPYNVNHGYGYTYNYQPVFNPTGTTEPTPIPEFSSVATIVVALGLVAVAFGTYAYRRKTK